ncbi:FeoB-associated Cys-rich membrane protein [Desulfosarcina sp. OttesenSCG-928-G10]|nr:FeoB-associated Cys-rich membrane protein [Desulfosarcina sp. OttesenSCG-928-G10]
MDKIIIGLIFLCAIVYLSRRFTKNMRSGSCGCGCDGCCSSGNKNASCHEKKD